MDCVFVFNDDCKCFTLGDYCTCSIGGNWQYCTDTSAFGYPDGAFTYTQFISR